MIRTSGRPRGVARAEGRAAILRAAVKIVRQEGWQALKNARVAAVASYNPALIGYYFGNMTKLREEVRATGVESQVPHVCRCEVCQKTI